MNSDSGPGKFLNWYAGLIERIPLPERGGFKGAILAVSFLFAMVEGYGGGGGFCGIHPWFAECKTAYASSVPVREHWRIVEQLTFGKGARRSECICHLDTRSPLGDDAEPAFAHTEGIRCGLTTVPENTWIPVTESLTVGPWWINGYEYLWQDRNTVRVQPALQFRLHCTDDPQFTPKYIAEPEVNP